MVTEKKKFWVTERKEFWKKKKSSDSLIYRNIIFPDKNSIKQNPAWKTDSDSAGQNISHPLWKPKVHYRVHKWTSLDPIANNLSLSWAR